MDHSTTVRGTTPGRRALCREQLPIALAAKLSHAERPSLAHMIGNNHINAYIEGKNRGSFIFEVIPKKHHFSGSTLFLLIFHKKTREPIDVQFILKVW